MAERMNRKKIPGITEICRKYRRIMQFGMVGIAGTGINTAILFLLADIAGIHYLLAAAIATETAIVFNFFGNNYFTFRDSEDKSPIWEKFLSFQGISLTTIAGTLTILWLLTTLFGRGLLLIWNLIAIFVMFLANYGLNRKFTWGTGHCLSRTAKLMIVTASALIFAMVLTASASADMAAVTQLGFHPDSEKKAFIYTGDASGSFTLHETGTGTQVYSGALEKARDFDGSQTVECQGNNPCLVADFTDFNQEGNFYLRTGKGLQTPSFKIGRNVFLDSATIFLEFHNALLQQSSDYHGDMHASHQPPFTIMADGSFITEADQAALTLIRLGYAYNRNPVAYQVDNHDILGSGIPDLQEYIMIYADYLKGLQGVSVEERDDSTGFRLNPSVNVVGAFVPGPTNRTELDIYIPGNPPQYLKTVTVVSLCGADDGSSQWDACMQRAAEQYKCQADEPCLNMSYLEKTGVISSFSDGMDVSTGWTYEFGCYFDADLQNGNFNTYENPCMLFNDESNRNFTTYTLAAYLAAIPAVNSLDPAEAEKLLARAVMTQEYIEDSYSAFSAGDKDIGFWGASLFMLYDYTGNQSYLENAHSLRSGISQFFISDATNGNEFYWEEYVRHKEEIQNTGLEYQAHNANPEEFFRGKIFGDYKDRGQNSLDRNAERVFQLDNNIQFQNSRFMLVEGLIAMKAQELHPAPEELIKETGDSQIAWLTGGNAVQDGLGTSPPLVSQSFIFGIGNEPDEFHTRLFVDTGYLTATGGEVVGARGTNYQYKDGSDFINLDGKQEIMGSTFGSLGNQHNEEPYTEPFTSKTFMNGRDTIPGWINGAYDVVHDDDVIFNYEDDRDSFRFTESTNEIVSIAMEYIGYLDAIYNNRSPAVRPMFSGIDKSLVENEMAEMEAAANASGNTDGGSDGSTGGNDTETGGSNTTDTSGTEGYACLGTLENVEVECFGGTIVQDSYTGCRKVVCESGSSRLGVLACIKGNPDGTKAFEMYKQEDSGSGIKVCMDGHCIEDNGFVRSGGYPVCTEDSGSGGGNGDTGYPNTTDPSGEACFERVADAPLSCTGEVTEDTSSGACRTIVCSGLKILACDKPDQDEKTHFEMYRQTDANEHEVCLGKTCISSNGYANSGTYPICTDGTGGGTGGGDGTGDEESNSTSAGVSAELRVKAWYPQGRDYVFICEEQGFTASGYNWNFGDDHKQQTSRQDVYHSYSSSGAKTVTCTAEGSGESATAVLEVTVE